jgi:magnesium transporter
VAVEAEPRETLEALAALFHLHPITLDDLINRNQRPKIEEFDEYVFLVIHALCTVRDDELDTEEIDIALRKNAVLTVHARPLEHLQRVFDRAIKDPAPSRTVRAFWCISSAMPWWTAIFRSWKPWRTR